MILDKEVAVFLVGSMTNTDLGILRRRTGFSQSTIYNVLNRKSKITALNKRVIEESFSILKDKYEQFKNAKSIWEKQCISES